ncbi:hypothetical protein QJS10_CPB18g01811 [Acorus calamus]|uniref:ATP-dependent DNA helicase n=1 Tax=Acorus calamus TaxID=4465 RepID=A0AAV9CQ46_ACOCL|nr:hypothetical protein QJS10_CPB18g01811 [Acorus calamus]
MAALIGELERMSDQIRGGDRHLLRSVKHSRRKNFLLHHAICVLRNIHAGIGTQSADDANAVLRDVLLRNRLPATHWTAAKALVINEVSMIDGRLFNILKTTARRVCHRRSDDVWGGIQIIASGDFFQLPPIKSPDLDKEFAFEADLQVDLSHAFRKSDVKLIELLQCIHLSHCNLDQLRLLYTQFNQV